MKSKRVLTLLLIGSIFFLSKEVVNAETCFVTSNNGICISETEYNNLLSMGFNDFEIRNMDLEIYNNNKNLTGSVKGVATRYIEDTTYRNGILVFNTSRDISEEEYNSVKQVNGNRYVGDGYTETTYKRLDTTIIEYTNKLRYKTSLTWKIMPSTRSYDIIGIGLDDDYVYVSGNRTFSQTYCTSITSCQTSTTADIKNQTTGAGASFQLPSGSYVIMTSYFYYDVGKKSGVYPTSLYAYGDYAHATQTVTQSQAYGYYGIGYGGLYLYSDIAGKYDSMNDARAHWTGYWS